VLSSYSSFQGSGEMASHKADHHLTKLTLQVGEEAEGKYFIQKNIV
jgi:hypothetical protein